jgi:predicted dehydrogenase
MLRREFLKAAGAVGAAAMTGRINAETGRHEFPEPRLKTKPGSALRAKPIPTIRAALIGVGARGPTHLSSLLNLEGVEVTAIGDLYSDWAERAAKMCTDKGRPKPALYTKGPEDYKKLLDRDDIDMVVISTPWDEHVPMSVAAMERGKHAFVEVPAATTLEGCWQLVETSERTGRHCMMMENVNYGREELMVLNMCRNGVFGDLLHGEAAYIHDLRGQMHEEERGTGSWRTYQYAKRNGNLYPTHGLGPVAQYMNVNRGDRFDTLVSMSSPSKMRALYAREKFPEGHKWRSLRFTAGDISTTIIQTLLGRTIMVQWDEQLPRPYTRHNLIQGTNGAWGGFPNRAAVEGISKDTDSWTQGADLKEWYEKWEHPMWKTIGDLAQKVGGHGGMDFAMMWRIVTCLRSGEELDQDVYDAAAWSSVFPLSEWSANRKGASVEAPDFTRGLWKTRGELPVVGA